MRSLLSIIVSVLNGEATIPELPTDKLAAYKDKGTLIPGSIELLVFLKIARLQTLIVMEQDKAELPEMDTLRQVVTESGQDFATVMARSLTVQEDTTHNIMMLERLIVGLVRDACAEECERFGVRYIADVSGRVHFSEAPQRRFMD